MGVLGSGGAVLVPGTFAARLDKSFSQRRRRFAGGVGLRTARAFAGRRSSEARQGGLERFPCLSRGQKHLVSSPRAGTAQTSRRLFFRRVRFSRIAADF